MKACIVTVRLLIDRDNSDIACDDINALLTEQMQKYKSKSSLIDWQYEKGGLPIPIDISEKYNPNEDDFPKHPYIRVVPSRT